MVAAQWREFLCRIKSLARFGRIARDRLRRRVRYRRLGERHFGRERQSFSPVY